MKNLEVFSRKIAKIIDPKIKEVLNVYVDKKTQKLLDYQINAGGKRFRPALAILSCLVCGGKIENVLYPAAGLEILHNYSLIIDDIIDNSDTRRGRPTVWAKYGRSIAQCIAIDYSSAVFQAANRSKEPVKMSELFGQTMKIIVDGEILDILFEQQGRADEPYIIKNRYRNITEEDYLEMIGKKTAVLIQASCEAGGVSASAEKSKLTALKNYGFNLGIAFQIWDDVLDIFGEEKKFGKKIGKDIIERKEGNIVILFALKELPKREKARVLKIIRKDKIQNSDVGEVIKLINQTDSRQKANLLGKKFIDKAKRNLNFLPKNQWNDILREIADFTIAREK